MPEWPALLRKVEDLTDSCFLVPESREAGQVMMAYSIRSNRPAMVFLPLLPVDPARDLWPGSCENQSAGLQAIRTEDCPT